MYDTVVAADNITIFEALNKNKGNELQEFLDRMEISCQPVYTDDHSDSCPIECIDAGNSPQELLYIDVVFSFVYSDVSHPGYGRYDCWPLNPEFYVYVGFGFNDFTMDGINNQGGKFMDETDIKREYPEAYKRIEKLALDACRVRNMWDEYNTYAADWEKHCEEFHPDGYYIGETV